MNAIPLSDYGLETVAETCDRKGWAAKTVQNWINAGLLPVVVIGSGRSAKFLLRTADVNGFVPPPRGRPKKEESPPPKKKGKKG